MQWPSPPAPSQLALTLRAVGGTAGAVAAYRAGSRPGASLPGRRSPEKRAAAPE